MPDLVAASGHRLPTPGGMHAPSSDMGSDADSDDDGGASPSGREAVEHHAGLLDELEAAAERTGMPRVTGRHRATVIEKAAGNVARMYRKWLDEWAEDCSESSRRRRRGAAVDVLELAHEAGFTQRYANGIFG